MSIALKGAGVDMSDYTDPTCAHGDARGAESLANYLWRKFGRPKILEPGKAKKGVTGHRGIVFFKDIAGFRAGRGDHIDLWSGSSTITGEYFKRCKKVWFYSL